MPTLSIRLLIPVVVVLLALGGAHLLGSSPLAVSPSPWPGSAATPAATAAPSANTVPAPAATPPPQGSAAVPLLPEALQRLNGSTRHTAVGLYAIVQQLEAALRSRLDQLVHQLEPGR